MHQWLKVSASLQIIGSFWAHFLRNSVQKKEMHEPLIEYFLEKSAVRPILVKTPEEMYQNCADVNVETMFGYTNYVRDNYAHSFPLKELIIRKHLSSFAGVSFIDLVWNFEFDTFNWIPQWIQFGFTNAWLGTEFSIES